MKVIIRENAAEGGLWAARHIDIPKDHIHILNGNAADPEA